MNASAKPHAGASPTEPDTVGTSPAGPDERDVALREQARLMALKIVVIVLGVILVAMAIVVFSTLIIRIVKGGGGSSPSAVSAPASPTAPATSSAPPPAALSTAPAAAVSAGGRVVSTALGDGRLAVTLEEGGRFTTILYDAATGREVARFPSVRPAEPHMVGASVAVLAGGPRRGSGRRPRHVPPAPSHPLP